MKAADQQMETKIEKSFENLSKKLSDSHSKSIKITMTFYTTSWAIKDIFEKWVFGINQLPPAEGQDENYINKATEILQSRMIQIANESLKCDYNKIIEGRTLADNFSVFFIIKYCNIRLMLKLKNKGFNAFF